MSYQYLEEILDKDWLELSSSHIFKEWILKPDNSKEKLLLSRFDAYIQGISPFLKSTKKLQEKIRNQFLDTYYELEVGCSLMKKGFEVNFEKFLKGKRSQLTPDIFIENDNVIVEVKTLHQSIEVDKGMKSHEVFTFDEAKRIQADLFSELNKYREQGIEHSLIVVVCPDIVKLPLESQDDFVIVLYYPTSVMRVKGSYRSMTSEMKYEGLYFGGYGEQIAILSGVGWWGWKNEDIVFYPNPNGKETSKISQGKFHDYL